MYLNRRSFLQQAGLMAAGLSLAHTATAKTVTQPGLQLYSLRDDMERDAKLTLQSVANMGYKEIESYPGSKGFTWGMAPAEFQSFLKNIGLSPMATHCGIEKDMPKTMDDAAAAGFKNVIVSWIRREERQKLDDYNRIADQFNQFGEMAKKRGMAFGYHNHDYPYIELDGKLPIDVLLSRTDPKLVNYEMDLFWVVEPGKDPIQYFQKYPGRFTMAHVKDRDPKNHKNSIVIGQGDLELAKMMAAGDKSGVKHFIVEVEEYGSLTPTESVKQSLAGLKGIQF